MSETLDQLISSVITKNNMPEWTRTPPTEQTVRILHGSDYFLSPNKIVHLVYMADDGLRTSCAYPVSVPPWKPLNRFFEDDETELLKYKLCTVCGEWQAALRNHFRPFGQPEKLD